jgi:phosphate-selective porin OprO/OprP
VGLNWYLNDNLKWVFDYEQTSFDGGAPGGADREDEKVFLTRFALGF